MFRLATLLLALSFAGAAMAENFRDFLVPEYSTIGGSEYSPEYQIMMREVLHEAYDQGVVFRMIVEPSFDVESTVFLKRRDHRFSIVTLAATKQIWSYDSLVAMKDGKIKRIDRGPQADMDKETAEYYASLPADYHDVKLNRCEVAVDAATAGRLTALWKGMLLQTHYTQPGEGDVFVTDGTAFHFSMLGDLWNLEGWTNDAPEGGKLAALLSIADAMRHYCDTPGKASSANLAAGIETLESLMARK